MTCCIASCSVARAQANSGSSPAAVQILEKLPDGSVILAIDGVKYRAITGAQIRDLEAAKINLKACAEETGALSDKIGDLESKAALAQKNEQSATDQATLERRRADEYQRLFENELALRRSVAQPPKRQNIVEKIFSNPVTQVILIGIAGAVAAKHR